MHLGNPSLSPALILTPILRQPLIFCQYRLVCTFLECYISEIIQHILFFFLVSLTSFIQNNYYEIYPRTSLAVQWLRLWASTAGGMGSIPGRGTKIPHVERCRQKKKHIKIYPCRSMPIVIPFHCWVVFHHVRVPWFVNSRLKKCILHLSIHLLIDFRLFPVWAITNEAALNIYTQVFTWSC